MSESDYIKRIKKNPFRLWLQKRWEDHKLEKDRHGEQIDYDLEDYFHRYKKFLIKDFKKENQNGD